MKYLKTEAHLGDADSADDARPSSERLEMQANELRGQIETYTGINDQQACLKATMELGYTLLDLDQQSEAWSLVRPALDQAISKQLWTQAVEACDILFQTDQTDAIKALAQGIWLGVTFPIDVELSIAMLQHLVDETPDNSDGAAVAAATASYLVDMRCSDDEKENLGFFTTQLMGQVARRHSQVDEQEVFDFWVEQLELNNPEKFLPRLAQVLDLLVNSDWWFDRDTLRALIPDSA